MSGIHLFAHYCTVHFDAGVGAHCGAGSAAYARVGVGGVGIVVAAVVNIVGLKLEHIGGTGHYAKVAPLATGFVDSYSSVDFCHR